MTYKPEICLEDLAMDARTAQYLRDFIKHDSEFLDEL